MDYSCEHVVAIDEEPRHHLVIANDYVRAFAVEIAPHDRTLCHHHAHDYLLYVAGDAEIISAARGEEPKRLSYRDGECELSSAGLTHVVENLAEQPFRNIVVELLPRADALRRGAKPSCSEGIVDISWLLDEERAGISLIEIGAGAEVSLHGPAIVATPYADNLNPAAVGQIEVRQNQTCDLAWIAPGRKAVLWGCWDHIERAVVFHMGHTEEQNYPVAVVREPRRSLHAHAEPE